jgi:hypothetical protein
MGLGNPYRHHGDNQGARLYAPKLIVQSLCGYLKGLTRIARQAHSRDCRASQSSASASSDCTERQQLTETTVTEQFAPQAEPYPEMLANFADAILHGTPLTAPGVEGVRALELTDAAYLSAWLGEKLTLPLDADRFEQELQKHIQEEQANG